MSPWIWVNEQSSGLWSHSWAQDPAPVAGVTAPQADLSCMQHSPAHCLFLQDNFLLVGVTWHPLCSLFGRKKDQKPQNQLGVFSSSLTSLLPYFYAWEIPLFSGHVYIPEGRIRLLSTMATYQSYISWQEVVRILYWGWIHLQLSSQKHLYL